MIRRLSRVPLFFAVPLAVAIGACTEDLETGSTCPLLCPGQEIVVRDTVIEPAYDFDSTLRGFPMQGQEISLLLATRGDTLDVRAVVRFDTLVRRYVRAGGDTLEPITYVDSAFLSIQLTRDTVVPLPEQFFIDAYDVADTTLADTARLELLPYFAPARLLGSLQVDSATYADSIRLRIPLDSAKLLAIVQDSARRLRIGLQIRSTESAQFRMTQHFVGDASGPSLSYRTSTDSTVAKVENSTPSSNTPVTPLFLAVEYTDYSIVANAPDISAPGTFGVGGLPAVRPYLRFDLPLWLTDTVHVLKAELELTQDPLRGLSDADTVSIFTHLVLAGHDVTDLDRAATLLSPPGLLTNTLRFVPSDSGVRSINIARLLQVWVSDSGVRRFPTAIVLRVAAEGESPLAARFFADDAADPLVRPRLRISYTPAFRFGRP